MPVPELLAVARIAKRYVRGCASGLPPSAVCVEPAAAGFWLPLFRYTGSQHRGFWGVTSMRLDA